MTPRLSRIHRVVVAVTAMMLAIASVCVAYDRQAAIGYARNYWDSVCSDGYYFEQSTGPSLLGARKPLPTDVEGFDCAHFVSCSIGSEPNELGGGLKVPSRTLAYGEPGAQRLVDWLLDQGATRVRRISALVPGDVVAYDADHNGWIEHVALYMGDGLVTAHSLSRYSEWNPNPDADIVLLHLPGDYESRQIGGAFGLLTWLILVATLTGLAAAIFLFSPR